MIRVGRCIYSKRGGRTDPTYPGFTNIVVLMKSHSKWGVLGPYLLKDEQDRIFENVWQFAKVYEKVPRSRQRKSRYQNEIIWEHPAETHVIDGELTPEYFAWREKGMNNEHPVRYPVGFHYRHKCLYALAEENGEIVNEQLDYVEARKRIYVKEYCRLVKRKSKFRDLKRKLRKGENLLIVEVDGPHQESLDYYKENYDVNDNFIEEGTMLMNEENTRIMLNDDKHPFGHGYCLALALLDKEEEWNQ